MLFCLSQHDRNVLRQDGKKHQSSGGGKAIILFPRHSTDWQERQYFIGACGKGKTMILFICRQNSEEILEDYNVECMFLQEKKDLEELLPKVEALEKENARLELENTKWKKEFDKYDF